MNNRSCENKNNIKKVENALKYELGRCEVETMDKLAEDLEDAARQHNSKILSWQVNKLRSSSQSGLAPLKDGIKLQENIKKKMKNFVTPRM